MEPTDEAIPKTVVVRRSLYQNRFDIKLRTMLKVRGPHGRRLARCREESASLSAHLARSFTMCNAIPIQRYLGEKV